MKLSNKSPQPIPTKTRTPCISDCVVKPHNLGCRGCPLNNTADSMAATGIEPWQPSGEDKPLSATPAHCLFLDKKEFLIKKITFPQGKCTAIGAAAALAGGFPPSGCGCTQPDSPRRGHTSDDATLVGLAPIHTLRVLDGGRLAAKAAATGRLAPPCGVAYRSVCPRRGRPH